MFLKAAIVLGYLAAVVAVGLAGRRARREGGAADFFLAAAVDAASRFCASA